MSNWLDLLLHVPWVLGLALTLATTSDAINMQRGRFAGLRPILSRPGTRQALAVAVGLLSAGFLFTARVLWEQVVWALFVVFHVGWLFWRWLNARDGHQPTAGQVAQQVVAPVEEHLPKDVLGHRQTSWERYAGWGELLTVVLVAPALWFPSLRPGLTVPALVLLLLMWLVLGLTGGRLWPPSRYDLPLILLLFTAALGAMRSPVPALTIPKVTSLVLGLAFFRVILRLVRDRRSLATVLCLIFALTMLFSLVGLTNGLRSNQVPAIASYLARLPHFVQELPEAERGQVSMNQLGGTLLFVLPLGLSLVLAPRRRDSQEGAISGWMRLIAGIVTLGLGATLALTQSRGAWVGMLMGFLCILALRWPWGKWAVLLLLVVAMASWLLWGRSRLSPPGLLALSEGRIPNTFMGSLSLEGRLRIWSRAFSYIQGSPFLGCGLGTFRTIDGDISSVGSLFDMGTPHAHNVYLQMAYDTGVPGLVAYLALLFLAVHISWRTYKSTQGLSRALAIGVLAALLAYHVYGLTDVVALGAKPGVLWWALLAVAAAQDQLTVNSSDQS